MAINLLAVANLLAGQFPQVKQVMQQVQGMAQAGNSPDTILGWMEQNHPTLKNNNIFQGLKGKSPAGIEEYAGNLVKTLGIFK